jgi:hypothetical protein
MSRSPFLTRTPEWATMWDNKVTYISWVKVPLLKRHLAHFQCAFVSGPWCGAAQPHTVAKETQQCEMEARANELTTAYRCFSIYFSSRKPTLPVQSKSNIKLQVDNSICLSSIYITRKQSTASLRLMDTLRVSPDTSTVYGKLCWLTALQNQ